MTPTIAALISALAAAIAAIGKLLTDRRIARRTSTAERQEAVRLAQMEQMNAVNTLVDNVTTSYEKLMDRQSETHALIVDGLHREIGEVRDRVARLETNLVEREGVINTLNETIGELNHALHERDNTIRRIRERLNSMQGIEASDVVAATIAPDRRHHEEQQ